jgi:hypothetical protein
MCGNHDHDDKSINRREALRGGAMAAAIAVAATAAATGAATAAENPYADPAKPALPPSDMKLDLKRTALVVTDPQIDFLSPDGVTWGVVGASVQHHHTVENIELLFKAAKARDMTVAVSPHYYYPTDHGWRFEGALEKLMHKIGMFDRQGRPDDRGLRELRRRFHAAVQAVYRRWQNHRDVAAQALWQRVE